MKDVMQTKVDSMFCSLLSTNNLICVDENSNLKEETFGINQPKLLAKCYHSKCALTGKS
jgi:hypothetical protein